VRKLFIAGNWKMNTTLAEGVALVKAIAAEAGDVDVTLGVMPPAVYLPAIVEAAKGSAVVVGAQNMHFEEKGAFTGEISTGMIKDVGATHVILGHSERRHVFGESDCLINKKVKAALAAGLKPILCIGELLEEREADKTMEVNERQITKGLEGVTAEQMADVVIAYEPVWAIGTGKVASPEQAQDVHAEVRAILAKLYNDDVAQATVIQYGGSVKPENAAEILAKPDVDGALVGGAALKADSFLGIAKAAS
jgi:triosephosphate isomerase (TIM)